MVGRRSEGRGRGKRKRRKGKVTNEKGGKEEEKEWGEKGEKRRTERKVEEEAGTTRGFFVNHRES